MKLINKITLRSFGVIGFALLTLTGCKENSNSPYLEYFPDMYRSAAIEPYVDYGEVRGTQNPEMSENMSALHPPAGTVPFHGDADNVDTWLPYKHGAPVGSDASHGLFGFPQDANGYENSAFDMNPVAYSDAVIAKGKDLYTKFCQHCHGEKGDGKGTISENGHITGIPDYNGALKELPDGKMFYSITYGKGNMGAHASILNKEERWTVVHYINSLRMDDYNGNGIVSEGSPIMTSDSTMMSDSLSVEVTDSL